MAANGTSPAAPPPPPSPLSVAVMRVPHHPAHEPITPCPSSSINSPPGRSSRTSSAGPAWNPAALLQPNRQRPSTASPTNGLSPHGALPQRSPRQNPTSEPMVFQFASTSAETPVESPGYSSAEGTPGGQNVNGVGHWIERMNNVQRRSTVPQPKRRRIDDEQNLQNGQAAQVRSGSGILGAYVREKRQDSSGSAFSQPTTVDLTDGESQLAPLLLSRTVLISVYR